MQVSKNMSGVGNGPTAPVNATILPDPAAHENLLSLGQVSQMVDTLKSRLGVDQPIALEENASVYNPFYSHSRTIFPGEGGPTMFVNLSELSSLTDGEREFVLLHELSHIKHRDGNTTTLANTIALVECVVGSIFVCKSNLNGSLTEGAGLACLGLVFIVMRITTSIFKQFHEIRADNEAFRSCSPAGKRGAFSRVARELAQEHSLSLPRRVLLYAIIFLFEGLEHPPTSIQMLLLKRLTREKEFVAAEASATAGLC
jgi:Zn-dependent protease with chaperone function